eukprot:CAMPEP_0173386190 /NCGR_PEP_ID=MMETSP1356-20130122/8789_1 /TAXON_ID=77927 ORGANISM="Hemiselmis virescens, Strain PCC157" /NCGR_SAMPLE_ID=MMETSP1356 /ASSEMBLY_ACC=CAM_ASM_000847 /LENGTH=176 /DNA_ID=CAMNT_0014342325 /DNA_START=9 /DNA_END=539 /DNA_ORIENTATION=-
MSVPQTGGSVRVGRLVILGVCAVAAAALVGLPDVWGSDEATVLQSSGTLQLASGGTQDVLSSHDYVPITGPGNPSSVLARKELAGLYAAAGRQMRSTGLAREQQLSDVSAFGGSVGPRAHSQIDPGSTQRLTAAAHGNLKAFAREGWSGEQESRGQREARALGSTIARYFKHAQKE